MADTKGGFPFWAVRFDEAGAPSGGGADALIAEVAGQNLTDVFLFSHGWNNNASYALSLYERVFGQMRAVIEDPRFAAKKTRSFAIGTVGILWPSMKWADDGTDKTDDEAPAAATPGAGDTSDRALMLSLKSMYNRPDQQDAIERMADLLDRRPEDEASLEAFQSQMKRLAGESVDPPASATAAAPVLDEDDAARVLFQYPAREVFSSFDGEEAPRADDFEGGAAGFNPFHSIWDGAKEAARQLTYWTMKRRAGAVGRHGLGPLIDRLHAAAAPGLRVHLMGHSFGARLVSFALAGLTAETSPVKSLMLIQGAFSHFAFSPTLPFDPSRSGVLAGMQARVDGPLLVTYSVYDLAVGNFYPLASLASQDDASAAEDLLYRWQGMGHDGAQQVGAALPLLGAPFDTSYHFLPGRFYNLEANGVIKTGDPPSGAHGDIVHPQIAWASLSAAGIV